MIDPYHDIPKPELCPICGQGMNYDRDMLDEYYGPIMGEYWWCPDCEFQWEYNCGSFKINIGDKEIVWSDNEPKELIQQLIDEYKLNQSKRKSNNA